tara:strand:- start:115 stop:1197 length:1083 start_codon:yes stop_codon:yes gene_type:complete
MWFNTQDIILNKNDIIQQNDISGYVLPHAGTTYTGKILSHTLRFRPKNFFDKILIIYYPANNTFNINNKYYHEFYVIYKTMKYICKHIWDYEKKGEKKFISYNVKKRGINKKIDLKKTLVIVSADFSHFLPLQEAITLENCAAHAILNRHLNVSCSTVIDMVDSFKYLYNIIPQNWYLQWIGRTRSSTDKGVGYLSFLIRTKTKVELPNGIFVTSYDNNMVARECLGEWFIGKNKYTKKKEIDLIEKVMKQSVLTSRLTNGRNKHIPVQHYSVTYLYKEKKGVKFIRGWHGIKTQAFYLPNVMLEHTFNNGKWITTTDIKWPKEDVFDINPTLKSLDIKAGSKGEQNYELYYSKLRFGKK